MSQPGGNRARFFPTQTLNNTSTPSVADAPTPGNEPSLISTKSRSANGTSESNNAASSPNVSLGPFSNRTSLIDASNSPRPASDISEDEIIAQRTRTIETETLYKAKKERHGKLNVSGLMRHKEADTKSISAVLPSATIKEIPDYKELDSRSPNAYSNHKLISKIHSPSVSAPSHFAPPSNQLSSSKMPPSRQPFRLDSPPPETFRNNHSLHTSRSDLKISHISTRASSGSTNERLKGLTTAFNRKHAPTSRPVPPRFASPIQNTGKVEGGLAPSLHMGMEEELMNNTSEAGTSAGTRRQKNETRDFDMECDEDELEEDNYQMLERRTNVQGSYTRGEKRLGDSDVEDVYAGKRARTEAYDEFPSSQFLDARMAVSPEPGSEINQHNQFQNIEPQERSAARDPQFKMFLGQDIDEYVAAHTERYQAAKKRWAECSREEWERGADELVENLTKVLDFVKDHVKRKVTLYTSLHTKIDNHQKEREETAGMLKEARRKLVLKTGVVVDEGQI